MTSMTDARELLGVGAEADAEDVRRAYRRLARVHHPDAGGDPEAFHALRQAVATLLGEGERPSDEAPKASPSRSGVRRPSTNVRVGGTGHGESTHGPRWHGEEVDLDDNDWEAEPPAMSRAWTQQSLAAELARAPEAATLATAHAESRGPRSRAKRLAGLLAGDYLAIWSIRPSPERGAAGHDVQIRFEFPTRRTRRIAEDAEWPAGWTRECRPSTTVAWLLLTPSEDPRATAVRATGRLGAALDALGWPLASWARTSGTD